MAGFVGGIGLGTARQLFRGRLAVSKEIAALKEEQAAWEKELLDEIALARKDGVVARGQTRSLDRQLEEVLKRVTFLETEQAGATEQLNKRVGNSLELWIQRVENLQAVVETLKTEVFGIKTFVMQTAEAAANQRRLEAEKAAAHRQQAELEQQAQLAQIRQELLEQLDYERTSADVPAAPADDDRLDPLALFNLQQQFVARRRAAEGEQYAGPTAAGTPQPGL